MNKRQKTAFDAFMMGVNWTLGVVVKWGELYDFTEKDAALIRERAKKIMEAKAI